VKGGEEGGVMEVVEDLMGKLRLLKAEKKGIWVESRMTGKVMRKIRWW